MLYKDSYRGIQRTQAATVLRSYVFATEESRDALLGCTATA